MPKCKNDITTLLLLLSFSHLIIIRKLLIYNDNLRSCGKLFADICCYNAIWIPRSGHLDVLSRKVA